MCLDRRHTLKIRISRWNNGFDKVDGTASNKTEYNSFDRSTDLMFKNCGRIFPTASRQCSQSQDERCQYCYRKIYFANNFL